MKTMTKRYVKDTKRYVIKDNKAIVDRETMTPNGIPTKIFVAEDPYEANKICNELNGQDQKTKDLEQELFAEKVQRLDERLKEYGGPNDEKVWQEEFGMSQREAKKKAGWSDWCYYPE